MMFVPRFGRVRMTSVGEPMCFAFCNLARYHAVGIVKLVVVSHIFPELRGELSYCACMRCLCDIPIFQHAP